MTYVEDMLARLSEQCAELQYQADEALRCGLTARDAEDGPTFADRLSHVTSDLLSTVAMLKTAGAIEHRAMPRKPRSHPGLVVAILKTLASEIEAGTYPYPCAVRQHHGHGLYLFIRPSHVMQHLAHSPTLRNMWSWLPIKSGRAFRRQLQDADLVAVSHTEKSIRNQRVPHLIGLSVQRLEQLGIHMTAMPANAGRPQPRPATDAALGADAPARWRH